MESPETLTTVKSPGDRHSTPDDTIARVMAHRSVFGITRIANLTGLDRTGVPVVMVCRPNARSSAFARKERICYIDPMRTTEKKRAGRTAMVPVTTMEEAPILSEEERAEMVAILKDAEARVASGECVEHDPGTFVDHLMEVRASAIRKKGV
jgi:hypothetical protein